MHFLVSLGLTAAAQYLSYRFLRQKEDDADIPDISVPTTSEGRKEPYVFGQVYIESPNVLWWGDTRVEEDREGSWTHIITPWKDRGKLVGYHYHVGIQYGLCQGEIDEIADIWINERKVGETWDTEGETRSFIHSLGPDTEGEGHYVSVVDGYLGSSTQAVNSYLDSLAELDPLPAYRGLAYLVFRGPSADRYDSEGGLVGRIGNQPRPKKLAAEVRRLTSVNPLSLSTANNKIGYNSRQLNPMSVAVHLITDAQHLNASISDVDTTIFSTAAATLATEENGMSLKVEADQKLEDVLNIIEKQINGFIFKNPATGKWEVKLARADYSIGDLDQLDEDNIEEIVEFRRPTWAGTTNHVNIKFTHYDSSTDAWKKDAWARMHDIANFAIQGRYVPIDLSFPGCADPELANDLATRELVARSRPFGSGIIKADRSMSHVTPGTVLKLTYAGNLNVTNLPIRVTKVGRGAIGGGVTLHFSEDIYAAAVGAYSDPPDSGWTDPAAAAVAVPTNESYAIEMPYAVARRVAPEPDDALDYLCFFAARQELEHSHKIYTRVGSDPYDLDASYSTFALLGTLDSNLGAGATAQPSATPGEDIAISSLGYPGVSETFTKTLGELGGNLEHLILIGDEFMLARDIENTGSGYKLKRVYRGVLDSARRDHSASAKVFYVQTITPGSKKYAQAATVDVQFRPVTMTDELTSGDANTETVTLANRGRRPYPPTELEIEGTRYPTGTISLDSTTASGSGLDDVGFDVEWRRRDFRIYDEVTNTTVDAATTNPDFPSATTTQYRATVTEDPSGSPTVLFSTDWQSSAADVVTRTEILGNNAGVVPSELRVEVETRHTYNGTIYTATQDETWDFDTSSSALSGLDNHGVIDNADEPSFLADATDTYVFTVGSDVFTGSYKLEAKINAGSYQDVITAGNTTGTLSGVSSGDTVTFRHTQAGSDDTFTHLSIQQQTGPTDEGYGILRI